MTVTCTTMTPPALEAANSLFYYSLNGTQHLRTVTVYVPENAIDAYKADEMWAYAASINPYTFE